MSKDKFQFYLKSRLGAKREVVLRFSFGYRVENNLTGKVSYQPFIYDTGVKITFEDWDSKKSIPLRTSDYVKVLGVKEKLETLYNHLLNEGEEITPQILKSKMDMLLGRQKVKKVITRIYDFIYEFVLEKEADKPVEEFTFSYNTRRNYRALNRLIIEFEKERNITMTAENLDREMYLDFQKKCREKAKKINTAWSYMKNLSAALRKISKKYKVKVFDPSIELENQEKISQKEEDKIYFEFTEIQKIIDFKPPSKNLRNVKLILLTLLFSGARYSDVHKVIPKYEFQNARIQFRYAHFITTKNPTEVIVPFMKPLEDAFAENNGHPPFAMSAIDFNAEVKELCKMIGFRDMKKIVYTNSSGIKEFEEKPLFRFVSSHIGRRSFISNFINAVSPTLITKITGHQFKMKDVVFKYNKIKPLKGALLFMKFIKSLSNDEDWQDEFPIKLVA